MRQKKITAFRQKMTGYPVHQKDESSTGLMPSLLTAALTECALAMKNYLVFNGFHRSQLLADRNSN